MNQVYITIEIGIDTKEYLDTLIEVNGFQTYEDAINFLIKQHIKRCQERI